MLPQVLMRLRAFGTEPFRMDEISGPRPQAVGSCLATGYVGAPAKDAELRLAETDMGTSNRGRGNGNSIGRKAADGDRSGRNHALFIHGTVRHLSAHPQITRTPPKPAGFKLYTACPRRQVASFQTAPAVPFNLEHARSIGVSSRAFAGFHGKPAAPLLSGVIRGVRFVNTTTVLPEHTDQSPETPRRPAGSLTFRGVRLSDVALSAVQHLASERFGIQWGHRDPLAHVEEKRIGGVSHSTSKPGSEVTFRIRWLLVQRNWD